jgi:hypothetical protein
VFGSASVNCTVAVNEPVTNGVKVALTVHELLAGTMEPHVVVYDQSCEFAPLRLIVTAIALPAFVNVVVMGALLVPTFCFPNNMDCGVIVMDDFPLPVMVMVLEPAAVLSVMLSDPSNSPIALGANVTVTVQLALGASAAGQLFVCV